MKNLKTINNYRNIRKEIKKVRKFPQLVKLRTFDSTAKHIKRLWQKHLLTDNYFQEKIKLSMVFSNRRDLPKFPQF